MIVTELFNGQGLGNQLANYVAVRCLALDKGYDFGVQSPEKFKGAGFMNLDYGEKVIGGVTPIEGQTPTQLPQGINHYYKETTSDYDPKIAEIQDNTSIHGNLQGIKYFEHRTDEVRAWLAVDSLDMPDDLCVINFRGGEYKYVQEFFLPKEYWRAAIDEMKKTNPAVHFEVHTDDLVEARKFFPDFKIVSDIGVNWRSIRHAKYLILSNSSFAILPTVLNTDVKRVIAPWCFARYNMGYWFLKQNYVPQWEYIDRDLNLIEKGHGI